MSGCCVDEVGVFDVGQICVYHVQIIYWISSLLMMLGTIVNALSALYLAEDCTMYVGGAGVSLAA